MYIFSSCQIHKCLSPPQHSNKNFNQMYILYSAELYKYLSVFHRSFDTCCCVRFLCPFASWAVCFFIQDVYCHVLLFLQLWLAKKIFKVTCLFYNMYNILTLTVHESAPSSLVCNQQPFSVLFVQAVSFSMISMFIVAVVGWKEMMIMIPGCSFCQFCIAEPDSYLTGLFY